MEKRNVWVKMGYEDWNVISTLVGRAIAYQMTGKRVNEEEEILEIRILRRGKSVKAKEESK